MYGKSNTETQQNAEWRKRSEKHEAHTQKRVRLTFQFFAFLI